MSEPHTINPGTATNSGLLPKKLQQYEFNGITSSNSSRDSSPLHKSDIIPSTQLPPNPNNIPASQLPPLRNTVTNLTQKVNQLSVSNQDILRSTSISSNIPIQPIKFQQNDAYKSMENVPLSNDSNKEIINRNVTVSNSNNMNLLINKTVLNDNQNNTTDQMPVNSLSQYFSQNRSTNSTPPSRPLVEDKPSIISHSPITSSGSSNISGGVSNVSQQQQQQQQQQQKSLFVMPSSFPAVHNIQTNAFDGTRNVPIQNLGNASQYNNQSTSQSGSVEQLPPPPPYSAYPPQINLKSNVNQTISGYGLVQSQNRITQPQSSPNLMQTQQQQQQQINQNVTRQSVHGKYPQMTQNYARTHPAVFNTNAISNNPPLTTFPQQQPNQQQQQQQVTPISSSHLQTQPQLNAFTYNTNVSSTISSMIPPNLTQSQPPTSINTNTMPINPTYGMPPPPTHTQLSQSNHGNHRVPSTQQQFAVVPPQFPGSAPIQNQQSNAVSSSINRYPKQQLHQAQLPASNVANQYNQQTISGSGGGGGGGIVHSGFNKYFGINNNDLLQLPNVLPPEKIEPPTASLGNSILDQINCSPDIFRSTMTKIPETSQLLQKSRLPLGLLIHPFKDLAYLPVIQCSVIVRCRGCRTYINPFVIFMDSKRWKCNLCFLPNELPDEFQYDPISQTYGDPCRRPEVKSSTIEYIAPAEYMLRPPQPAIYLFLLDISKSALASGYLAIFCRVLIEELKKLPGDGRTQVGFIAYSTAIHVFTMADGTNQPNEMIILDIDDVFVPVPEHILINLKDGFEMIVDFLKLLPQRFDNSYDDNCALGSALQLSYRLLNQTGGRVTIFQEALPNHGPGALTKRENPNQRASADVAHLNPANDFYKKLALEFTGQQIAVDLFVINSQYMDMATVSGISRFSGGCVYHFPLFNFGRPQMVDNFSKSLKRYLTRKIGFEAVMRVRCTKGLAIHTFHGNIFVRSTDLLSLPNINPDAGFGMQVAIEESLSGHKTVCFQAALLYTSSKGERRIRVHTLCLPVAATLDDIIYSADQQCIVGLLGKMAVDRSMQSSLTDAREAFINAAIDTLSAYKLLTNMGSNSPGLFAPDCLKLLPLYISAILKHPAFRIGISTKLDDRVKAMIDMKSKPLSMLIQQIYPDLYPIYNLENLQMILNNEDDQTIYLPPRLQLSSRCIENKGAYLMDCGDYIIIFICAAISRDFLQNIFGISSYSAIPENLWEIPKLDNPYSKGLRNFLNYLTDEKSLFVPLHVIRDNNPNRIMFLEKLVDDRLENSLSYHEFLQHIKVQVK